MTTETTYPNLISDNAFTVLEKRYFAPGETSWEDVVDRVAKTVANGDDDKFIKYKDLMMYLRFVPNSPCLFNAGLGNGLLSACFVIPIEDDMESIMKAADSMAFVQKHGGGTGFPLTNIRPKGAPIQSTHGKACGPIAVLRVLSQIGNMITQGGKRDSANMAVMAVTHPDIEEFIDCKKVEGEIHNFNISVGITDAFMEAVEDDGDWDLTFDGEVYKTVRARELMDKIVEGAWRNGEPGAIFLDAANRHNPVVHLGEIQATNPCGEQNLAGWDSCNLGSIDVAKYVREDMIWKGNEYSDNNIVPLYVRDRFKWYDKHEDDLDFLADLFEWDMLRDDVHTSIRFLDDMIDVNNFPVPEIAEMNRKTRRIGLGIMGFADALTKLGIPYDSEYAWRVAGALMKSVQIESYKASRSIVKDDGKEPYPALKDAADDAPVEDYPPYNEKYFKNRRNAFTNSIAPTGTISMIAGCSSGIEPLFGLVYKKHNILGGESLFYVNEQLRRVLEHVVTDVDAEIQYIHDNGVFSDNIPEHVKAVFKTSSEILPSQHVAMQASFQIWVDTSISKTINLPNEATVGGVGAAYMHAHKSGCKGITVYRDGSRELEVLTKNVKEEDEVVEKEVVEISAEKPISGRKSTPLMGTTHRIPTSRKNAYITVNLDEDHNIVETFVNVGKSGSQEHAAAEALGRLTSLALRNGVPVEELVKQLRGIVDEPVWFEGQQVQSLPDALGLVLDRYIIKNSDFQPFIDTAAVVNVKPVGPVKVDDNGSCPSCDYGAVYNMEGCLTCYSCGWSKC